MKHIISIGINKTEGLTQLGGAVSGAEDFAKWGISQGYTTTLLVDTEKNITQSEIFDAVNKIVSARNCETLLVFFSGHGILKSPSQEVWLLSNAKNNPNESVNLTGSIDNARTSGIPYVVFISDACRVLPNEMQFTGNGSVIFPISDDTGQECAVDVLYATRPGNPALEQNSTSNAKKFGLFTQTLVEVLNGAYPELIYTKKTGDNLVKYYDLISLSVNINYKNLADSEWQIDTISSEQLIKNIVAQKASNINISLTQTPDIRIQYQNPKPNLAVFNDQQAKQLLLVKKISVNPELESYFPIETDPDQTEPKKAEHQDSIFKSEFESWVVDPPASQETDPQSAMLKKSKQLILDSKGRVSFETQTGFTIIGSKIKEVLLNGTFEIFTENNMDHIRIHPQPEMRSGLIVFNNGQSIPVAVLYGYIGTLIFEKGNLLTVNYTRSGTYTAAAENSAIMNSGAGNQGLESYEVFAEKNSELDILRASVASKASMGIDYSAKFKPEFLEMSEHIPATASAVLREDSSADPSLSLFAAYALRQEGKLKGIQVIYEWMKTENHVIIFDVAMLAGKMDTEAANVSPFCPMMALGWAYSQHFEKMMHPLIMEASAHLVPGLWTTFDEKGTEIMRTLFNQKLIS